VALLAPGTARADGPVASHAMVHTCCMPLELKERIFAESKELGASFIRVDFELGAIFGDTPGAPNWKRVDQVLELSRRYDLPVLGIVLDTPAAISTCPDRRPGSGLCAAADTAEYGRLAAELAAHARATVSHWEIVNEPDGDWAFKGSPEEYARMLSASYDAIKARVPEARVAMGGVMTPWVDDWVERVFATPGADAAHKFDIANIHLRGPADGLPKGMGRWRAALERHGVVRPLWITEHGYSADPAYQSDPAFKGGDHEQAAYLERSLLRMAEAGAERIFVTLRDIDVPDYAAEGVTHIDDTAPFASHRRPAFDAVRRFVERWPSIVEWRALQRSHQRQSEVAGALAARAEIDMQALERIRGHALEAVRSERARLRRASAAAARCKRRRACPARTSRRLATRVARRGVRLRQLKVAVGGIQAQRRDRRREASYFRRAELAHYLQAIDYALRIGG
jgi:Glycosyl hydrolase catalytic core